MQKIKVNILQNLKMIKPSKKDIAYIQKNICNLENIKEPEEDEEEI